MIKKSKKTKASKATKPQGNAITKETSDSAFYNALRFKTATLLKNVIGKAVPSCTKVGYLLKTSDRGVLIDKVKYNAAGWYERTTPNGVVYGNLETINEFDNMEAQILTKAELIAKAKKFSRAVRMRHVYDDSEVDVALLNSLGDSYVAAIRKKGSTVEVSKMEHPANHNAKLVQFKHVKDLKISDVL